MGSCISHSPASSPAGSSGRRPAMAKVVGLDGSMTQYAAPVTACEALGNDERNGNESVFLCSSDELRFDAAPRALANEEELQPGWLYFLLPVSMLHVALRRYEMAALAIRASSALAVVSGVASPPRLKNVVGNKSKQRKTARVAPLVSPGQHAELADGEWSQHAYGKYGGARKTVRGGSAETAGKTRKRSGYRSRGARHRRRAADDVPRLSATRFRCAPWRTTP
ncbi:uncharacterized protein LOC124657236 [Lolium rigidum]|uniref:uncharacterized protein LOC124657236 n=1 Tax=Lolium rigidum TaxID=89674 RepID=UPI001F5CEE21|nr:uncharacterized protein LOC124657236 [Lolium rigidum]XP_051190820.1 uncharacterized protein LOC127304161 [Lolium perenne]